MMLNTGRAPVLPDREVLDAPIGANDLRRKQLKRYVAETYVHHINFRPIKDKVSFDEMSGFSIYSSGCGDISDLEGDE
jgi:hypothetical protein